MKKFFVRIWLGSLLLSFNAYSAIEETPLFTDFVNKMVAEHQFDQAELRKLFKSVEIKPKIIKTMQRPAEAMPWHKYRKIFIQEKRIRQGVDFWQQHADVLAKTEEKYGVPAEIITAIIGVETNYGGNRGYHRVIDALSTLAFNYPKRSKFFTSELKNFLILCREEKMDPLLPIGSYAGAMGIPQFMPSSYRAYAADFENDGRRDIWENPADAIASVANYFVKHRWRKGEAIAYPVKVTGNAYQKQLKKNLKPHIAWQSLQKLGVQAELEIAPETTIKLLSYQQQKANELWAGLHNFYVITRYNHSPLYAMAVFQLSQAIKQAKQQRDLNDVKAEHKL